MQTVVMIALTGLAASLFGCLLLAISLNSLLNELTLTAKAHDLTIQQLADPVSDVVVFTGLDSHVDRGQVHSRRRTVLGVLLVGLGSVLQAVAILLSV